MKNTTFLKACSLLLMLGLFFLYSCEKENIEKTDPKIESVSSSDENSEFIDGVSQADVIVPIDLDVEVVDGLLIFTNHEEMINAMDVLFNHNLESVVAWGEKVGFKSLFTELARIEELPMEQIVGELEANRLRHLVKNNGEEIELAFHDLYIARVLNTNGLMQVDEFVGTVGNGVNVWVKRGKESLLIDALDAGFIPDSKDFIVYDDRINEVGTRDWWLDDDCPKDAYWTTGWHQYKNPNANRRIDVKYTFAPITTPRSNGLNDYTCKFITQSVSRKASWNKYKTNHYWNQRIEIQQFNWIPSGNFNLLTNNGQNNKTKYGGGELLIAKYTNVSSATLASVGIRLKKTWHGATSISHRGMGGLYVRCRRCD